MSQSEGNPSAGIERADYAWLKHYPADVDWGKSYAPEPLWTLLDRAVAHHPERVCTNFLGRTLTYSEIGARVDETAAGLAAAGIGKGSRVGLFLPNCPTFIVYYYAALKLGATIVNYNPLYSVEELAHQVADSGTDLMVTLDLKVLFDKVAALLEGGTLGRALVCGFPGLLPAAKAVLFKLFKSRELAHPAKSSVAGKVTLEADLLAAGAGFTLADIDPMTDVAVLQYTGGTTGVPKGAMLTHANLFINCHQVVDWEPSLGVGQERVFGVLPFFHVFAMTVVMNYGIAQAAEIIIMPRFVLDDALKLIHKTKPTVMPGVPTLFNAIIHHPNLAKFDVSSLKFCISGGAPLPLDVKSRFQTLTGCKLVEGYGLSESSPVATANPVGGPVKEGSIGQPLPQTVVSLRDLADPEIEVPIGEKGEVCIKGPQVMAGYWGMPDATDQVFIGEYLRTGDVAVMDEEGFFYIVDRIKDLIISSGFNVYPRRIEEAIYDHPDVEETTVIGIKDDYRGEAPKAFVKLRDGARLTEEGLMAHLEPKLAKIELPAEIEFRAELPKTMVGKLSKKELKQEEEAKRAQA